MENQSHIFDELTVIFSQERLDGYLVHAKCNNSKDEALIAYSWNMELSQALYPALQILEIALRNSLHHAITTAYNTEFWFELSFLHNNEKGDVQHAKEKLIKEKKPIEPGRLVANYLLASGQHFLTSDMNTVKYYGRNCSNQHFHFYQKAKELDNFYRAN